MSGSKRLRPLGLLVVLTACPPEADGVATTTGKGDPNDPSQPSSTTHSPTTGDIFHPGGTGSSNTGTTTTGSSSTGNTTSDDPGSSGEVASTGAPVPPGCGDGILDPGKEQCDEKYLDNSDHGSCTASCKIAVCGDGLLWVGKEECDHGDNNNDMSHGGCTESCTFGPRCGDGVHQPDEEECDASAMPVDGAAPCDPQACRFKARVAFVTAAEFSGALGGLALGDATCAATAANQGLDNAGSFKVWLSNGVATPQGRLKNAAADPGYPYARLDGQLLADDLADLIAHGPKVPLDITETGAVLPPQKFVWTNIGADGEPFSPVNHCMEWTSEAVFSTARAGKNSPASAAELPAWKAAYRWTSDITFSCITAAHLYCFED